MQIDRDITEAVNLAMYPDLHALSESEKNKLAEFYVRMTQPKVHLNTILAALEG